MLEATGVTSVREVADRKDLNASDRLALGLHAKAGAALFPSADAIIGDERLHGRDAAKKKRTPAHENTFLLLSPARGVRPRPDPAIG